MPYVKPKEMIDKQAKLKDDLLNAAVVILGRSGLHAVTIRSVADYAETSVGYVYKLYPNKDELVAALSNRKLTEELDAIGKVTANRITPRMKMAAALTTVYGRMAKRPWLTRSLFEIPHYRVGMIDAFRKLVEGITADDAGFAATVVISVLYGAAVFGKREDPEMIALAALRALGLTHATAEAAVVNARYESAKLGE
jgi:AcrR family transcriptional regulator